MNLIDQLIATKENKQLLLVERGAKAWTEMFLASKFLPPPNARYVFRPRKHENECDILRSRHECKNPAATVTITQTIAVFAVQLHIPSWTDKQLSVKDAEGLAKKLFTKSEELDLKVTSSSASLLRGTALPSNENPTWLNGLYWWQSAGNVGFFFLKDEGRPSKLDKTMDTDGNLYWFSKNTTD